MSATNYPERLKIDKLSKKGLTDRQIAEQSGLSISTDRKWRRKLKNGGKAGVLSQMGRPKRGALSSYPVAIREQLKMWCKQHPGWGAETFSFPPAFAMRRIRYVDISGGATKKLAVRIKNRKQSRQ